MASLKFLEEYTMRLKKPFGLTVGAVTMASLLSLTACGGDKDKPTATQLVAKVNGNEISVHQLNSVLEKAKNVTAETADLVRVEAIKKLVEQQLAYEKAIEKRLDRTPVVVMAIENAKREIIARAYLQQTIAGLSEPSAEDVTKYYEENPALFSERKIYNVREVAVEPREGILEPLKQRALDGQSLEQITTWLTEQGVKFRLGSATRTAEQVGMELLPILAKVKDGGSTVFQGPNNYLLVHIVASKLTPVTKKQAHTRIVRFLSNVKMQKTVAENVATLKDSATVEYVGDFAALMSGQKTASSENLSVTDSTTSEDSDNQNTIDLNKGVGGL